MPEVKHVRFSFDGETIDERNDTPGKVCFIYVFIFNSSNEVNINVL